MGYLMLIDFRHPHRSVKAGALPSARDLLAHTRQGGGVDRRRCLYQRHQRPRRHLGRIGYKTATRPQHARHLADLLGCRYRYRSPFFILRFIFFCWAPFLGGRLPGRRPAEEAAWNAIPMYNLSFCACPRFWGCAPDHDLESPSCHEFFLFLPWWEYGPRCPQALWLTQS